MSQDRGGRRMNHLQICDCSWAAGANEMLTIARENHAMVLTLAESLPPR